MKDIIRIATVAADIAWKDVPVNLVMHAEHVAHVMKRWPQTDLILFPELSLMGFVVDASNTDIAESLDGQSVRTMQELARKHNVALCFGLIEQNPADKPKNTLVMVDNGGSVVASYSKNHLFTGSAEPEVYSAGESLTTFDLNGWKCGLSICFDIRFPRLFESYKNAGVELMLSGFNWVEGRNKPEIMDSLVKARAHENQCFFAAVDCVGTAPNISFYGKSVVSNPYAEDIAERDGLYAHAELNKSDIASLQKNLPLSGSYKPEYTLKNMGGPDA